MSEQNDLQSIVAAADDNQQKTNKSRVKALVLILVLAALLCAGGTYFLKVARPNGLYKKGVLALEHGDAQEAYRLLTAVPKHEQARELLLSDERLRKVALGTVGGTVRFGHFEQDNDSANGPEPIEWVVLEVQESRALLITRYAIDYRKLHKTGESVEWKTCDLRAWLNTEFPELAFTASERAACCVTRQEEEDTVFLLSGEEAGQYFPNPGQAVTQPTPCARAKYKGTSDSPNAAWWLRSRATVNGVPGYGYITATGIPSGNRNPDGWFYVRPALWVDTARLNA